MTTEREIRRGMLWAAAVVAIASAVVTAVVIEVVIQLVWWLT
jgi:hypothetical protein